MTTNDKRKKPDSDRRRAINCLVAPETLRLLKPLAAHLKLSQGAVLDRAVAALAVAESFGGEHLRLSTPVGTAKLYEVKHTAQPDYPATHLDATGIDRDSKRGKATVEIVQPRRDDWAERARSNGRQLKQSMRVQAAIEAGDRFSRRSGGGE